MFVSLSDLHFRFLRLQNRCFAWKVLQKSTFHGNRFKRILGLLFFVFFGQIGTCFSDFLSFEDKLKNATIFYKQVPKSLQNRQKSCYLQLRVHPAAPTVLQGGPEVSKWPSKVLPRR